MKTLSWRALAGLCVLTAACEAAPHRLVIILSPPLSCATEGECGEIPEGDQRRYVAQTVSEMGEPLDIVRAAWRTIDPSIATVDGDGLVTGHRVGETVLVATYGRLEATQAIQVLCPRLSRAEIHPGETELEVGSSIQLGATLLDLRGRITTCHPVTWDIDNLNVATISESGLVIARSPGLAIVNASGDLFVDRPDRPLWTAIKVLGTPIEEPALFHHIQAGSQHTCALDDAGAAHCWGSDDFGQLGRGSRSTSGERFPSPAPVLSSERFVGIALGASHSCGLDLWDKAWCWGLNASGQTGTQQALGDGFTVPRPVLDDHVFVRITAGAWHTCGLDEEARAWCWGINSEGQLGLRHNIAQPVPAVVVGNLRFTDIAGGLVSTCALDTDGRAYCWGAHSHGQIGHGADVGAGALKVTIPTLVLQGEVRFAQLDLSSVHVCAVTRGGEVWCWGGNLHGQLGDGTTVDRTAPVKVETEVELVAVAAGGFHTCGLDGGGRAWCWGYNGRGQLGNGSWQDALSPVPVAGEHEFVSLSAGGFGTCAVTAANEAYCWGSSYYGQLGNGDDRLAAGSAVPIAVSRPVAAF